MAIMDYPLQHHMDLDTSVSLSVEGAKKDEIDHNVCRGNELASTSSSNPADNSEPMLRICTEKHSGCGPICAAVNDKLTSVWSNDITFCAFCIH